ncbi:MAG: hypothetical protein AUH76_11230 [Candidatus Rokubacteria bacterium 13_1_40CM_4_67_11]|nr:MAG: hypothetical protein AUH76_11230 [Candidatus Rokubacteria bacterium 13_1_40CM_4_67_11]
MDLLEAKSRIAEALVESIFRRARYQVEPYPAGRTPLRFGREDFSPDFSATVPGQYGESSQEMLVEVKYRPSVEQFISVENQRGEKSVFLLARRQWPSLYFILVTDRPEAGRSCFQALPFSRLTPGEPFRTVNLDALRELRIFKNNIEDHEELVRRIFGLLAGA